MSKLSIDLRTGVLAILLLMGAGCGNAEFSAEVLPEPTAALGLVLVNEPPSQPLLASEPTVLPPPVIKITQPTATPPPSPTTRPIYTQTPIPTATPAPIITPTNTITTYPVATETAVPTVAAVVRATFTPPAEGAPSPNEHYWLYRPVPQNSSVWTDKVYPYGSTRDGTLQVHHGVEFAVPQGTDILAAQAGTVIVAGNDLEEIYGARTDFYGGVVIIQHNTLYRGQPVYTLYAHLSEVLVSVGWQVDTQQVIARSGSTGVALGPHLHFEVRVGANSYDHTRNPLLWLSPFKGRGSVAGLVALPDGSRPAELSVTAHRLDGAAAYHGTTTYADGRINGDDAWQENFALDDVYAGYYQIKVRYNDKTYKAETWVYPQQTSFVTIQLDG